LHRRYLPHTSCDSIADVTAAPDTPPDDIAALRAALAAEQMARREAEACASGAEAMVAHLKLLIARLKRDKYGASSERGRKLLDQLELELGEWVAAASEDATKAEDAAKDGRGRRPDQPARGQPARTPLPAHLPRERVVLPAPTACPCCGGKLSKLGEDVTETLEVEPIKWKVIQTVRERFSCRSCETITQPPAPFHPIARGRAGPNLLAMVLEAKFGQHQPLNRQSDAYALQGIELSVSTLADWVGTCTANLAPLMAMIDAHVLAAARLHGDDTTVPVLARGKTITGRVWTYARDDRPFGGPAPPAAMFRYSRDRTAEHPNRQLAGYAGILQADAYAGYNALYEAGRKPGPITGSRHCLEPCWAHGRRKLFELAELQRAPLAIEAVRWIDTIFDAERAINGLRAEERLAVRRQHIAPLVTNLETWMKESRGKLSRHNSVAKAMDYMLTRWEAFTRFLNDGRVCLTNNAAERAMPRIALGRKSWLFAGSDRGGDRAAAMVSLITAKLNDVDPRAWLADVLARIADQPASRLHELLPWHWREACESTAAAKAA
jgi:transposase